MLLYLLLAIVLIACSEGCNIQIPVYFFQLKYLVSLTEPLFL